MTKFVLLGAAAVFVIAVVATRLAVRRAEAWADGMIASFGLPEVSLRSSLSPPTDAVSRAAKPDVGAEPRGDCRIAP